MVQLVVMDGEIFLNLIPPFKLMSQPSPMVIKSLVQEITQGSPNYAQRRWNTVFLFSYIYNKKTMSLDNHLDPTLEFSTQICPYLGLIHTILKYLNLFLDIFTMDILA